MTTLKSDPFTEGRYRQFVRHFTSRMRRALDVGCNTGRGGAILRALLPDLHITGFDSVPARIAALDPRVYDAKICGFTLELPLDGEGFDAIVAGYSIKHLAPYIVFPGLCKFFRLLRLRVQLLLTTIRPRYLKEQIDGGSVVDGARISQRQPANFKLRLMDIGSSSVSLKGSDRVSEVSRRNFPVRRGLWQLSGPNSEMVSVADTLPQTAMPTRILQALRYCNTTAAAGFVARCSLRTNNVIGLT